MTNEDEILKEAHEYAAAMDRREERREVYLLVAGAFFEEYGDTVSREIIAAKAEAIYQGMIKFAGEGK